MTRISAMVAAALVVVAWTGIARADLFSVDFQTTVPEVDGPVDGLYVPFVTMSGVEPFAAAADADFNAADVWNVAGLTSHFAVAASSDTNPSWSNLVNSTGTTTPVGFAITGSVVGTEVLEYINTNGLNNDGLAFDVVGASATLEWAISGLVPGTPFKLFLNQLDVATWGVNGGPPLNQNRAMSGLIDTDGDGTPNEAYQMNFPGVLVEGTVAADGIIRGTSVRTSSSPNIFVTEPDWAGFQLIATPVPEPASCVLLSLGLFGIGVVYRSRSPRNG